MEYVRLGKTGMQVSRISLGCMSYGSSKWMDFVLEEDESLALMKDAWDAGINFWDTASGYSNGKSEELVGKAIKKFNIPRSRLVLATKVFMPVFDDLSVSFASIDPKDPRKVNNGGLSRKFIFDSVNASLKRLDLDYIDLLYIHRFDNNTPIEETMEALNDLVRSGKVRYLGASSMYAWQFARMNGVAEKNGWTQFVAMQDLYNLLYREEEREMIPYLLDQKIGQVPWSPLDRGLLARPLGQDTLRTSSDFGFERIHPGGLNNVDKAIVNRVEELAKKKSIPMSQVALAWVLSKPAVSSAIVGINKSSRIADAVDSLKVKLTEEELRFLEEPYLPRALQGGLA
ncbi:Aldo/keto reductase [Hesseltinella vesiculosa]|uniref:Aldo/keto reductase n=1 Tax=Hesseltinella vesiculosa TaxID=101127 RepID=A0A1X2GDW7_9FUNG|nr:Aldo/keto reductase [Hesseltinella vesiculosa]